MTLFTPEDLLLYLHKESSPELTSAIDAALKENWALQEELSQLQSSVDQLDKLIVSPRMEVVLKVMHYARETAVESMPQR